MPGSARGRYPSGPVSVRVCGCPRPQDPTVCCAPIPIVHCSTPESSTEWSIVTDAPCQRSIRELLCPTFADNQGLGADQSRRQMLLRKEVIQPHLPVRLPCYDFVPITDPTFGSSPLAVGPLTSGVTDFRDVTGGVYKARERIHRSVADLRLLATPTSWGRVADPNPN